MEFLLDIANKFGAPAAPILAIWLGVELLRSKKLNQDKDDLTKELAQLSRDQYTSNLELKHAVQVISAITTGGKP